MTHDDPPVLRHTPDEEREIREAALDQTIEDSFPASDAPSTIPNPFDHDAVLEASSPPGADRDQLKGLGRASRARSGAARRGPS